MPPPPTTGDYGADLILSKDGRHIAVQVKRYVGSVGVAAVQEALSDMAYYKVPYRVSDYRRCIHPQRAGTGRKIRRENDRLQRNRQGELGRMYSNGATSKDNSEDFFRHSDVVKQPANDDLAVYWYRKAAEQGHFNAQEYLKN